MPVKSTLDEILQRLRATQQELEQELDRMLAEKRAQFRYHLQRGRVVFEQGVRYWHREQRVGVWRYLRQARLSHILSAPVIYGMIVPLVILDLSITLYQQICFRIYRIPRISRSRYLVIDRHRLGYLNVIEKLNCVYCGYGNGIVEYAREVIARTEQYWCPIKHARRTPDPHRHTQLFFDFGDAEAYRRDLEKVRREWR